MEQEDRKENRVIRIRKHEVIFEEEKRIIVIIRDLTDTINFEKMQLK